MKNLKKSWKTTVIGLMIIAYNVYNFVMNGVDMDFTSLVSLLIGLGFLVTEDATASHTMNKIVDPDKDELPKTKF